MLKRQITYTDFNDETVTDTFYFNISKNELIELEVEYAGGFSALIERIIETTDPKRLVDEFKRLILLAYGVKSDDGKRFIKSDELRAEFETHAAYQTLFTEMATVEGAAEAFFKGVLPADMTTPQDQDKPTVPPRPIANTEGPQ